MPLFTIATAENIVAAILAVLSFTLLVISVVAFLRRRNLRIALISGAFLLFFCEGVLFTAQLFYTFFSAEMFYTVIGLISVAILILIFAATFKR